MLKYKWTTHSKFKMQFYRLSESRVRRVIKSPLRVEEGIAPNTVAVMQPSSYKGVGKDKTWNQEIWVMYVLKKNNKKKKKSSTNNYFLSNDEIKIISAWRYPGKTKARGAIADEIMDEIQEALHSFG